MPQPPMVPRPNIREVLSPDLEEELQHALGGQSVEEILDSAERPAAAELEVASRVVGTVSALHRDEVFVDLGGRNQGVISVRQFEEPPAVGDAVEAFVVRINSDEGLYELNRAGASVDVSAWEEVTEGIVVNAIVTGFNKGGLECQVGSLRGFIPASQVSVYRVENLEEMVGERLACVVTESNAERRNLVLSRRATMERERAEAKEKLMQELRRGEEREGIVSNIRDFGAFVDLGGVDGLIHVSRLSWDRVSHPSEVLEVGQKVKVKVEKIDEETGKIGLSLRDTSENPWNNVERKYPVKSTVRGVVAKIMDFGALVRLEPGISGLVHISELSHRRVFRVADVVKEGEQVEAQVVSVDADAQRIGLSMKALEARPVEKRAELEEDAEVVGVDSSRAKIDPAKLKGGIGHSSGGDKFGLKW